MNTFVATRNTCESGGASPDRSRVGGKGYNLIRLRNEKLVVPEFFVLTSEAFMQSLKEDVRTNWNNLSAMERLAAVQEVRLEATVLADVLMNIDKRFTTYAKLA